MKDSLRKKLKEISEKHLEIEKSLSDQEIINDLEKYKKIADFIDLSGGLETSGLKDKSKIEIFLNNLNKIKNEA